MKNDDLQCVYHVRYMGRIVYIGSGKSGRPDHVNSGCSHNPHLNRHFFLIGPMEVDVVASNLTKKDALALELRSITLLSPEYNVKKRTVKAPSIASFRSKSFGWLNKGAYVS